MAKMYIESDNGGRSVVLNSGDDWYICDCSPWGRFGDVDILLGTDEDAAHRIRAAIESGELYDADEQSEFVVDLMRWRIIPEWHALSAHQIECVENAGKPWDSMTLTEI